MIDMLQSALLSASALTFVHRQQFCSHCGNQRELAIGAFALFADDQKLTTNLDLDLV